MAQVGESKTAKCPAAERTKGAKPDFVGPCSAKPKLQQRKDAMFLPAGGVSGNGEKRAVNFDRLVEE
jgi:hypothetical protein